MVKTQIVYLLNFFLNHTNDLQPLHFYKMSHYGNNAIVYEYYFGVTSLIISNNYFYYWDKYDVVDIPVTLFNSFLVCYSMTSNTH